MARQLRELSVQELATTNVASRKNIEDHNVSPQAHENIRKSITDSCVDTFNAAKEYTNAALQGISIDGGYVKPPSGIPKSDMAAGVQTLLDNAETALQPNHNESNAAHPDIRAIISNLANNNGTAIEVKTKKPICENVFGDAVRTKYQVNADGTNYDTEKLLFGFMEHAEAVRTNYTASENELKHLKGVEITGANTTCFFQFRVEYFRGNYDYTKATFAGWINKNDFVNGLVLGYVSVEDWQLNRFAIIGQSSLSLGYRHATQDGAVEINGQVGDWVHINFTTQGSFCIYIYEAHFSRIRILDAKYCFEEYVFDPREHYKTWADKYYSNLKGKSICLIGDSNVRAATDVVTMARFCAIGDIYVAGFGNYRISNPNTDTNSMLHFKEFVVAMNPDIVCFNTISINNASLPHGTIDDVNDPNADTFYKWYYQMALYILDNETPVNKGNISSEVRNLHDKCIFLNKWIPGVSPWQMDPYPPFLTKEDFRMAGIGRCAVIEEISNRLNCGCIDIFRNSGFKIENANRVADGLHPSTKVMRRVGKLQADALEQYFSWSDGVGALDI